MLFVERCGTCKTSFNCMGQPLCECNYNPERYYVCNLLSITRRYFSVKLSNNGENFKIGKEYLTKREAILNSYK